MAADRYGVGYLSPFVFLHPLALTAGRPAVWTVLRTYNSCTGYPCLGSLAVQYSRVAVDAFILALPAMVRHRT